MADEQLVSMNSESLGQESGPKEFLYVTARFSRRYGVELHLLSDPASPGQILVYGCEVGPDSTEFEDHRLDFFQLDVADCCRGKKTLKESDRRAIWIMERYLQHRDECNLAQADLQYLSEDTQALRSMREAVLAVPVMVQ